MSVNK
jgi:hypothetical protein